MKKMISCLLLVVLAFPAMALADPSFDFVIANSVFNKNVYSSPAYNSDSVVYGGVTPNATNLQGDDYVVFSIVNTSNSSISDGVTCRRATVNGTAKVIYYDTSKTYWGINVKLKGKFAPRDYEAYIRGTWAP